MKSQKGSNISHHPIDVFFSEPERAWYKAGLSIKFSRRCEPLCFWKHFSGTKIRIKAAPSWTSRRASGSFFDASIYQIIVLKKRALLFFNFYCHVWWHWLIESPTIVLFVCLAIYCLFVWLILCLAGPDLSIDGRPPARDISHHLPDDSVAHFLVEAIFSNNFSLSLACVARCSGSLLIRALPWGVLFWHKYPPPPSLVVSVLSPHE